MTRALEVSASAEAFALASGELGMLSAARLFVREAEAAGGRDAVAAVHRALGSVFPVLDAVARRAVAGTSLAVPGNRAVAEALAGCTRVLFVGLEVDCVEPLTRVLAGQAAAVEVGVVLDMNLPRDEARVRANLEAFDAHRITLVPLTDFQRYSGRRSALVTTVYGSDGFRAAVCSSWIRIHGPDARTQFRSLVGWDVLGAPLEEYPRWLSEVPASDFTELVSVPADEEVTP